MKILHPDHIRAYLDAAERRGVLPMFYLELISGLRKGELVALQWTDLDEANCTISISKQASWDTDGTLILSQPKTGNSIREVSIPQDAVDLLIAEHGKHPENPYMFPSPVTGEMYYPDSVVNLHKKILKDNPFETIDAAVLELVRMAVEKGRAANPDMHFGVCGEHGGDPKSIKGLFNVADVDYVSCSPYRVPLARLAAAQAKLEAKRSA